VSRSRALFKNLLGPSQIDLRNDFQIFTACGLAYVPAKWLGKGLEMEHNQGGRGGRAPLKISQKGLYALQAIMTLARRYGQGAIKIRDIAAESDLPEKFLELILLELKNARIVDSVRGARGGYQLRRDPAELPLSDIIRLIDGPLAPMGDAEQLRGLIAKDADHRALYEVFLAVRDAAAKILENTTIADIVGSGKGKKNGSAKRGAGLSKKKATGA
jgi:Rrf2 family cysteine metabolism transcriptional repressor